MSGENFVEALRRLGYPKVGDLDGGSLDWVTEYEATQPFLEWFCDEVQANNRLDPKDLEEFHGLEQTEDGILEGEQLEEALHTLIGPEEEDLSDDALKQEIAQLEEDLKSCQHRKEALIQQRNKLSSHKAAISTRLTKLNSVENAAKASYKQVLHQCQADNTKMNTALDDLLSCVVELSSLYRESSAGTEQQRSESPPLPVFLSQLSLESQYTAEEQFTTELTAFTKKQFFDGIARMAGDSSNSRYEFLEISNPDSLLVAGEKESIVLEACKELTRLQIHYPKSESLRVKAVVEEMSTVTACDFIEQKHKQLKDQPYPMDIAGLSNRLKDAQGTLNILRRDLMTLAEQDVPRLIKDSATLQVARILRGDYDLKIARQDYFMSNQEQVIEMLVMQRSRNEFLTMGFELEAKGHRDTYRLITAINMLLQKMAKAQKDRVKMLKDPMLSSSRNQRSTLDSRDKFFTKLHKLLDPNGFSDQPQLFITYSQLADHADRTRHQLSSLQASCSTANNSQDDRILALEKSIKNCDSLLYSDSSTVGGQPSLSPQPIVDSITQLDSMLQKLEKSIVDIMKDVEQKKKLLHNDPLLATERELFAYFFNDPDRLRRVVDQVSRKLDARLVT